MDERTVLQMKGVKKYFPGVKALDGVNFDLERAKFMRCWAKTAQVNLP